MIDDTPRALVPSEAEVADLPARRAPASTPAEAEPPLDENELRCTLCGLRACWTG